jgi:DNA recombination protein RmuC
MTIVLVLCAVAALVAGAALGAAAAAAGVRRRQAGTAAATTHAVEAAVAAAREQAAAERDTAVHAALQQAAVLQRTHLEQVASRQHAELEQLVDRQRELLEATAAAQQQVLAANVAASQQELAAKKDVIDARLDEVRHELRAEMTRLGQVVHQLGQLSSERFGQVDESLRAHAEITGTLAESTRSLREALANPKARGQWGERMAEDVLRLAGFVENVNYVKQTQLPGGTGLPDFTFRLPKGHVLYMDVKFPLSAYLRFLEAATEAERSAHRDAFLRDVKLRVRELAARDYAQAGTAPSVDYVLLFLPNEQITGFIHEHDPDLIEQAMAQKVVLCSPLTLFAFLGVIRQAFDNFMVEQTSDEILKLLGRFSQQWGKFSDSLDVVKRRFDSVQREFDSLASTRRRMLERPLADLEDLRRQRNLPIEGQLFPADVLELGHADELGA